MGDRRSCCDRSQANVNFSSVINTSASTGRLTVPHVGSYWSATTGGIRIGQHAPLQEHHLTFRSRSRGNPREEPRYTMPLCHTRTTAARGTLSM
jgi:hypothetical protein